MKKVLLSFLLITGLISHAHALRLGEPISVSRLGQPFEVLVPIENTSAEELERLRISMAPIQAYQNMGIEYDAILDSAVTWVRGVGQDKPILQIRSPKPMHNAAVEIVFELSWGAGKVTQTVPVFLDDVAMINSTMPSFASVPLPIDEKDGPPQLSDNVFLLRVQQVGLELQQLPDVSQLQVEKPINIDNKNTNIRTRPKVLSQESIVYTRRIKSGDTLYGMAMTYHQGQGDFAQYLTAMAALNKKAFLRNNPALLKPGAKLRLPTLDETNAVPQSLVQKFMSLFGSDHRRKSKS